MKKLTFIFISATLIGVACKAKKPATTPAEPGQNELSAVQSKIPATTLDELKQGHSIFYGACTRCHGAKNVTGFSEEKLQNVITRMSKKAKLTEPEKDAVWKYALAVNLKAKSGQ
jgi:hypothetical protein